MASALSLISAMPANWQPATEAFGDGLSLGLYAVFAAIAVLIVIATVRKLLAV